jgi:hypothetical protein
VNSSSSKAVTTLLAMKTDLVTLKTSIDDNTSERQQFMNHFQELDRVLEARRQEQRSLGPLELTKLNVIALPDERVIIEKRDRDSAPIDGNFDGQPVYFERVQITGDRLPRLVKIYRQIGDVALVQKLLGIAEINEKQYIMMQNLKSYPSIEDAIQDQSLGAVPYLQKLRFAYELSATVSSLHQNGLLVKVLSDVTVFVEKTPEEDIRPLLSDLKSARDVSKSTATIYEANLFLLRKDVGSNPTSQVRCQIRSPGVSQSWNEIKNVRHLEVRSPGLLVIKYKADLLIR